MDQKYEMTCEMFGQKFDRTIGNNRKQKFNLPETAMDGWKHSMPSLPEVTDPTKCSNWLVCKGANKSTSSWPRGEMLLLLCEEEDAILEPFCPQEISASTMVWVGTYAVTRVIICLSAWFNIQQPSLERKKDTYHLNYIMKVQNVWS